MKWFFASRPAWVKACVMMRWYLIRKEKPHHLPAPLIISLTSYPPRYGTLAMTLRSILRQTIKADRVILWIAHEDAALLPKQVMNLTKHGLEIMFTDDLKSHKKTIPTLEHFPDAYIATADDDIYYWPTWLEELTYNVIPGAHVVHCHRAHYITTNAQGEYLPYDQWVYQTPFRGESLGLFPTSGAGALYYPGAFCPEVLDRETLLSLCPYADDVWLYWMGRMNGTTYKTIGQPRDLFVWSESQDSGLYHYNVLQYGNDVQIKKMAEKYGYPSIEGG